ncbi:MAG: HNH endonuclease [Burkholderiales bacterium]|nr:HNH endonuclease [Burkholderiales bacterium]
MKRHSSKIPLKRDTGSKKSWYSLKIWADLRRAQLDKKPLCEKCESKGYVVRANTVDHIKPFKNDWWLFTDPDNLQSLCKICHDRKTYKESLGR